MNHSPKTTIHVTSIPSHLDRADLKKTFAQYSGFTRISFHADYCFACFEDVDSSTKAIDRIHQTTDMLAAYAKHGVASNTTPTIAVQPNPILYVSVFPYFTESELVKIFKSYEGFDSTRFFPTHALVRFNSVENARVALEDLNFTTNLFANYSTKGAKNGFSRPSSAALSSMGRSEETSDRQGAVASNPGASGALGGSGSGGNSNGVNLSVPKHTIHVTNIKLSKLGLKNLFSTMVGFRKVAFYQDYCFVIFDDVKAAAQAIEDILFKTKMKANFAKAEFTPHPPPSVGQANSIIRISDFPPNTTDNDLYEFFESYDCFQDIQYYHASCLVYFDDVASARNSLEDINATTNFTAIYSKKGLSSAATTVPPGSANSSKTQNQKPMESAQPPSSPPFVESEPVIHSKSEKLSPPRRLSITSEDTQSGQYSPIEQQHDVEAPTSPEDVPRAPTQAQSPTTAAATQQLSPDSAETLVAQLTTSAPQQSTGAPKFAPISPTLGNQTSQGLAPARNSQLDPNAPAFAQSNQAIGGTAPREGEGQKAIGFNSSLGNYLAGPPSMFMPAQLEGRGSSSTLNDDNSQSYPGEDPLTQAQHGTMDGFHPYMIQVGYEQRHQQPYIQQQLQMQPVFHQQSFQSQPGNPYPQSMPQQGQQQQQPQQQQQGEPQRQQQRGQSNGPFLDESGMRPVNEGMDAYSTNNYLALTSTSHVAQYSTIQTSTIGALKQVPPFQATERMTGEMIESYVHGAKALLDALFLRVQTLERENDQLRGGQPKGRFMDGWYEPHQAPPHNSQQQHQQPTVQQHNAQHQQQQQLQLQQEQEQQQQHIAQQFQQVPFGGPQRIPQQMRGGGIPTGPTQDTNPLSPRAGVISPPPASQSSQRNIQMEFEQLVAENERLRHENMVLREELSRKNTDLERMESLHRTVAAVTAGAGSTSPLIQPSNGHMMGGGTLQLNGKPDWAHGTGGGLSSPPPSSMVPSKSDGTVNGTTTVPATNGVSSTRSGTANGVALPVSSGAQMSGVASFAAGNPHTLFLQHMQHPVHSHHHQHGIQQNPLMGHKFSNPVSPKPAVAASGPGLVNKPFPRLPTFSKW
ncbi:hypothetical protein BJ742DRAFT_100640 [Cladochytrium replicatum]|nr:hypothetical protein BJ742DRAFT_100640 [Cladochytrium replicatum]